MTEKATEPDGYNVTLEKTGENEFTAEANGDSLVLNGGQAQALKNFLEDLL